MAYESVYVQVHCYHNNSLKNTYILSKLYMDVLHINILDEFDIDLFCDLLDLSNLGQGQLTLLAQFFKECLDPF